MGFFRPNYDKPGPGIPKNAPPKKGIKLFFDVYLRAFWELLKLNMIFVVYCLPSVALAVAVTIALPDGISALAQVPLFCACGALIGPPCAGMTKVTMLIVRERPFFVHGDYKDAIKSNMKQSLLGGALLGLVFSLLLIATQFYYAASQQNQVFYVVACLTLVFLLLIALAYVFFYPMMVTVALPFKALVKNSFLLGVACLKQSLAAVFVVAFFGVLIFLFLPFTILLVPVWYFSFAAFVFSMAAWPGMQKYVIREPGAGSAPAAQQGDSTTDTKKTE